LRTITERLMQERNIQRKVRPSHPGKILRNMLEELAKEGNGLTGSLTQKELAKQLGVSRRLVNDLINERRAITADMAIRLSRVFETTPDIWMNLQKAVDLWDATEANKNQYAKLRPIAA
jgi:antitoxin HigA-1